MVRPIILNGDVGPQFFFNIDGNVGPHCPNRLDDVQLVQLGYFAMSQNFLPVPEELRQAAGKVFPGAPYTGNENDPLTVAIKAHEKFRGGPQDGHVSVALSGSTNYDPKHSFIIISLNFNLNETMRHDFPRLDKHPKCPAALRVSVLKMLLGGGG